MTINEFENRAKYQGGYDRRFDNWKIIDIHQIPNKFEYKDEIDFFCSNDETVYLLRLRNRKIEFYDKVNSNEIVYLIAELPITKVDDNMIKNVLTNFEI